MTKKSTAATLRAGLRHLDRQAHFAESRLRGTANLDGLLKRQDQLVRFLGKNSKSIELSSTIDACNPGSCSYQRCSGACFFGERYTVEKLVYRSYLFLTNHTRFAGFTDVASPPVRVKSLDLAVQPSLELIGRYRDAIFNMDPDELFDVAAIGIVMPCHISDRVLGEDYWELTFRAVVAGQCGELDRWRDAFLSMPKGTELGAHDSFFADLCLLDVNASAREAVLDQKGKRADRKAQLTDGAQREFVLWLDAMSGMRHVLHIRIPTKKMLGKRSSDHWRKGRI